ncbi:flagellar motor switch phosphatase FliY [Paenibacillus thermoaerophilus]|uniref:Flagellar motor switch phosphatase FliY n=1 Tax=Paenibacillus thermoaerophilus TaxID=1215385 RepID=A0ABW2V4M1_9BACL|nr:flagellar motor switch phosphatase FliY [Paenibacillus thermoaerophilus]TMV13803.1 flagellar motor switch phosphatase FliY [Paenibacillus thermoaerophilus]
MTSKDYLSQEEIDALLRQSSDGGGQSGEKDAPTVEDYLSSLEQDALGEIGNITFGSAATALSTLLGQKVDITTPQVSIVRRSELQDEFPKPHVAVSVRYVEGFDGINMLVIKTRDAQVIADLMMGGSGRVEESELTEIHISAVQEAMNQMMGSSATSMSTIFNRFVNISPPGINILDVKSGEGTESLPEDDVFIKISFRLMISDLVDSTIMQLLPVSFAKQMVDSLMGGTGLDASAPASSPAPSAPPSPQASQPAYSANTPPQQQEPAYAPPMQPPAGYGSTQPQMPMYGNPYASSQAVHRGVNVQPAQFADMSMTQGIYSNDSNLNLLLDIPLKVTVELGRTKKQIKEILEFSQGSIIELDKLAGEPVDILVNNKLIAKGEVVVIDENFGVRVTDIISPWERMQKLQ